ncbi:glycerate kinase [Nocardioides yefusunii]|uniref:Glycerate kinase n=1 Tax=Nocardioides yefusunii TaxID=2500546 RepID=A0ABW1QX03_9ACTN|nr:glycerate kinase [Nocardioides yefusunii]
MRVVFAPDKFAGTLTAPEAAEAMAAGWRRHVPDLDAVLVPMADGGPGFVDVLHSTLGGDLLDLEVSGPHGSMVPAQVLLVPDAGGAGVTAYVESAHANGLHLTGRHRPRTATTRGVGELVAAAVDAGATRIVLGAGGSGTNDGGAGMLAGLGVTADVPLDAGPDGLRGVTRVDLAPALARLEGIELVLASDVDNPLTGMFGAPKVFGPQKGLDDADVVEVDALLSQFARCCDLRASLQQGAGAAGGLGYAALLLGAVRRPGFDVVADAVGLTTLVADADLAVTGEGCFDAQSGAGKVPHGVAQVAQAQLRPCVVLAGAVEVGAREARGLGVEAAYGLVDMVGRERAFADAAGALADVAERVARSWSAG